jgi:hypothetical protein
LIFRPVSMSQVAGRPVSDDAKFLDGVPPNMAGSRSPPFFAPSSSGSARAQIVAASFTFFIVSSP